MIKRCSDVFAEIEDNAIDPDTETFDRAKAEAVILDYAYDLFEELEKKLDEFIFNHRTKDTIHIDDLSEIIARIEDKI